ncbi:uncharacterized protein EDB93DRAFT_1104659 [Suillus bovinus]|uniref:uncharacterized protein n=1 Tax=Suillus bovinus TaxID=48563 RepID=UPI001B869A9E|nr:uncharacterized protein EDB93DRAFT_1104659 [Suillus bovinus]KAG2145402.1 hypothetical protein EDB93DRAFT_1104659 [Suillus bovinus]
MWFWSIKIDMHGPDQSWNEEFYQVHWLRAKALRDQWKEELIPGNWPGQPMSEFEKFIHPSVDDIFTSEPTVIVIASGGCKQQSSPLAWIRHFKAGLQWKITTFVMPILQYSAARNIISVIPSPIAHILHLIPGHTWNMVPDHIFSYHIYPGDPSLIVSSHDTPWWMGETAIPNKPWQWDRVMTCCIFHYQHWLDGIENDGLTIPEQVDHTSVPSLMGLRWIREHLLTLLEEQHEASMTRWQRYKSTLPFWTD